MMCGKKGEEDKNLDEVLDVLDISKEEFDLPESTHSGEKLTLNHPAENRGYSKRTAGRDYTPLLIYNIVVLGIVLSITAIIIFAIYFLQ